MPEPHKVFRRNPPERCPDLFSEVVVQEGCPRLGLADAGTTAWSADPGRTGALEPAVSP